MNWFIAVPAGGAVIAVVLGLLIGRGIRIGRGVEPELPVTADSAGETAMPTPPRATGTGAGAVPVPVAADAVVVGPDDEPRPARSRESSLTGAR